MSLLKYTGFLAGLVLSAAGIFFTPGCKKDHFDDTSFAATAASAGKTGVMFTITQDNTGLVTIIPSGEASASYDITLGDTTKTPVSVTAGNSLKHIYAEGTYQVKITGHDLKGGTSTTTQTLTVSYITPQNLAVSLSTSSLTVTLSATAQYATFYKIYYGDSNTVSPIPYTLALAKQVATHTYKNAGAYTVKVIALSGGSETAEYDTTIHVANPIDLPVTFEDPNTDYTVSDFGGNASTLTVDPTNNANHVMKSIKTAGAQTWAGTTIGGSPGFATPVPLKTTFAQMTVMVYSPAAGLDIKLKMEDHADGTHSVETDVLTTKAGQWEMLTFDFTHNASGTPALNAAYNYDKASIFFDFNVAGTGKVFYFDDVKVSPAPPPPALAPISLPVTFESTAVDYTVTDFGGNVSSLTIDPTNISNHVIKTIKPTGSETWAGTTIGGGNGFATPIPLSASRLKFTVRVYSPAAGIPILLKLEDHTNGGISVQVQVNSTVANLWETLTFDFSQPSSGTWSASNTYDKASLFFDFNNAGSGKTFYWDDVIFL